MPSPLQLGRRSGRLLMVGLGPLRMVGVTFPRMVGHRQGGAMVQRHPLQMQMRGVMFRRRRRRRLAVMLLPPIAQLRCRVRRLQEAQAAGVLFDPLLSKTGSHVRLLFCSSVRVEYTRRTVVVGVPLRCMIRIGVSTTTLVVTRTVTSGGMMANAWVLAGSIFGPANSVSRLG